MFNRFDLIAINHMLKEISCLILCFVCCWFIIF